MGSYSEKPLLLYSSFHPYSQLQSAIDLAAGKDIPLSLVECHTCLMQWEFSKVYFGSKMTTNMQSQWDEVLLTKGGHLPDVPWECDINALNVERFQVPKKERAINKDDCDNLCSLLLEKLTVIEWMSLVVGGVSLFSSMLRQGSRTLSKWFLLIWDIGNDVSFTKAEMRAMVENWVM